MSALKQLILLAGSAAASDSGQSSAIDGSKVEKSLSWIEDVKMYRKDRSSLAFTRAEKLIAVSGQIGTQRS